MISLPANCHKNVYSAKPPPIVQPVNQTNMKIPPPNNPAKPPAPTSCKALGFLNASCMMPPKTTPKAANSPKVQKMSQKPKKKIMKYGFGLGIVNFNELPSSCIE